MSGQGPGPSQPGAEPAGGSPPGAKRPPATAPPGQPGPGQAAPPDRQADVVDDDAAFGTGDPLSTGREPAGAEPPSAPSGTPGPGGPRAPDQSAPGPGPAPEPGAAEEQFVDGTVGRSDLAAERDDAVETAQRVKAEFDNYKRRTAAESKRMSERASERIVNELLPVLDACDAAVAHGDEGVLAIHSKLLEVLGKEGLEPMNSEGTPFDPNLHEAVLREEGEGGHDTVSEVLRTGYLLKGHVVRPAMVKVKG